MGHWTRLLVRSDRGSKPGVTLIDGGLLGEVPRCQTFAATRRVEDLVSPWAPAVAPGLERYEHGWSRIVP